MQPISAETIADRLGKRKLAVSEAETAQLAAYLNLLEAWNRVHNLTGTRSRDELVDRHLVESLALEPFIAGPAVADVGSGAGLPGMPLAIVLPAVSFTLIESRRKRASFLRHVAATLGLDNVTVAHARVEELEDSAFATVVARAVAPPLDLLELIEPIVGVGGRMVLLTSEDKKNEILKLATGYRALPTTSSPIGLKSRILVMQRD